MLSKNLKKINIDISEDSDSITCNIEIMKRGRHCKKKIYVNTDHVVSFLQDRGYKFVTSSGTKQEIKNWMPNISRSGVWIFKKEKPKRRTQARKPTSTRTKKQATSNTTKKQTIVE
tara:strand:- start:271 stop:618 length:348 start_codon:yes stop_codon:yes gene_type:complete